MTIINQSKLTGKIHEMELDVTNEQVARYMRGEGLVQDIFPNLTSAEREFIVNGITPQEWETFFGKQS